MSEGNGQEIIKVGKRGLRKFQHCDESPVVTLDVIHVSNQWAELDDEFREPAREGEEAGVIPPGKMKEYQDRAVKFVAEILQAKEEEVSKADAFHFIKLLTDEVDKLKDFFLPESRKEPSSHGSTEVTFSE